MPPNVGAGYLDIVPEMQSGWQRKITTDVDKVTGGIASKFKSTFSGIALAAGGIFAGTKVVQFLGDAVDAGRESIKIGKLTNAAIKSTGGVANVTEGQVADLAEELSNLTGIDDELIQSSENLLLSFTNVRNEAGKGNKIFNRATKAALDLSARGFGSVESASVMLGKALNDPLTGITALGRAGVTFTEDQKEMIAGFVESGDLLSAQGIILDEVARQVGGSAEAAATPWDRLKVTLGNLQEEIGMALIPILDSLAGWLADTLPGAIESAKAMFEDMKPTLSTLADAFATAFGGIQEAGGFVIEHWDQFQVAAGVLAGAIAIHAAGIAASWAITTAAAVAASVKHAAEVAIQVGQWAVLGVKALFHGGKVAAAWLLSFINSALATAGTITAATAQGGAWAGLAVAAETNSARIAKAWLGVLGPAAAVIAAAETINNLTGNKMNPNDLSLWERLDPRKAFDGMDFDIPFFNSGGVVPGRVGAPQLVMAHAGETVLPTHNPNFNPDEWNVGGGEAFTVNVFNPVAGDVEAGVGRALRARGSLRVA